MVGRNPGHPPPTVEAQMAGSRPIGANIAVVVAPASWWAKHIAGEGRGAHHPRLSLVSTPPGVDAGPEPVPGLVPGARHDVAATTVLPANYVGAYAACPGHLSRHVLAAMART